MKEQIKKYLSEHRDQIVATMKSVASIPAIKGTPADGAPYGKGPFDALCKTEEIFKSAGLQTAFGEDNRYLKGMTRGDEKLIGIFCHADVVPVNEEDWIYTKPFDILEKDGFLIGRGVKDNKSGLVAALFALKALQEVGASPKSRVLIFAGSDEESGMTDVMNFAEKDEMPNFSLVPDLSFPVCRGEKSILDFWAHFKKPFDNIIDIKGGSAFNIVLGNVDITLRGNNELYDEINSHLKDEPLASASMADGVITLSASGISTHGASPLKSLNALKVAIDLLLKCSISENDKQILSGVRPILSNPFLQEVGLYSTDVEFGDTTCTNGIAKVENGKLSLSFDCRYGTKIDGNALIESFKSFFEKIGAEYQQKYNLLGFLHSENAPLIEGMMEAYREVTGDTEKKTYLSLGGTYSRFIKNAVGVGSSINKEPPFDLPKGHGEVHQPDEAISIDGLIEGAEILAHMIIKADNILHS